jgi:twitching motility two-component system response regulator PilH
MAKILVADDSLAELQIIQQTLQSTGHSIVTVMDGEAAEAKAKSEKFDLIILDVIMPKKNGFQVCREIKTYEQTKNIPIIICSSKGQDTDRIWGLRQGAREYLVKPVSEADLMQKIAALT